MDSTPMVPFTPLTAPPGFPTAIDALDDDMFDGELPRTLLELRICAVASAIRDRKNWWQKLSDDAIVSHWREEACQAGLPDDEGVFKCALEEVRWQASAYSGVARPAAAHGTFMMENMPTDVVTKLLAGVENVRAKTTRDVHPGSDGLVIDLVHPSMYAYEQGVTPVLGDASVKKAPEWKSFIGNGAARPGEKPVNLRYSMMVSPAGLTWLPSEFVVSDSGDKCTINSYINSLHPHQHKDMYDAVAEAFLVAVPLFEQVLNFVGKGREPWEMPLYIDNEAKWVEAGEEGHVEARPGEHPFQHHVDFDIDMYGNRTLLIPKLPSSFTPPTLPPPVISLWGKELQVIVKLASIELTPEQPRYDGGTWHVEGMRNERIVATTCMYLEAENVTESSIEFRTAVCAPEYEQNDVLGVKEVLGLFRDGHLVQPRGTSRTLAGRALAWPNTLQHRVRPFELADKTRPGRRTISCFFLVDPTLRVRSTATVPPQMNDWITRESRADMLDALPQEVRGIITSYAGGMTFEDACDRRQRLMDERGLVLIRSGIQEDDACENSFFQRPFALCEH